jgi:hypothetical protein
MPCILFSGSSQGSDPLRAGPFLQTGLFQNFLEEAQTNQGEKND